VSDWYRFNEQFRETPDERRERLTVSRLKQNIRYLQDIIETLSADLADEGPNWSAEGLEIIRRTVANALPEDRCPDWLKPFRDPKMVQS